VVDFLALYWLLTTPRRVLVWLLAFSVGIGLKALLVYADPALQWKFGLGAAAFFGAVAVVLLLDGHGSPRTVPHPPSVVRARAVALLALVGVLATVASLWFNARSAAAAFALSAMLMLLCLSETSRARASRMIRRRWGVSLLIALVLLYGLARAYVSATEAGWLGQEAQSRLALQLLETRDPVFGLIAGGRGEFFASLQAILDAPIIGHGSWARSAEYYGVYVDTLRRMGAAEMATIMEHVGRRDGHILPTHSHVLGAWVEAGIAGAAFWVAVAWMLAVACARALRAPTAIGLVLLCALPGQIWALAFSPLGADGRLFWALLLVGACRIMDGNERPPLVGPFARAGAVLR
jgi:O-antigen ligase